MAGFRYLRNRFPGDWDTFLGELEPETMMLAKGPCLKGSWYPFSAFVDVNVKADRRFGKGDLALAREMGRHAARTNLPVLYELFYKVGSPGYIFNKVAGVFKQIVDSGEAQVVWNGPTEARLELRNFADPHAALCRSIEGFLTGFPRGHGYDQGLHDRSSMPPVGRAALRVSGPLDKPLTVRRLARVLHRARSALPSGFAIGEWTRIEDESGGSG